MGANLQDHLQIRPVFKVQGVRTLNVVASSLWGRLGIGLEYALRRTGPMSMAPSQLGAFVRSDPGRAHANLQYHVQPLEPARLRPAHRQLSGLHRERLQPQSHQPRQRAHPQPRHPRRRRASRLTIWRPTEDRRVAADSLRVTRRIVAQPALARYAPEEYLPGAQFTSDEDLVREGAHIANTIFHPVGTARMGAADDPAAVVDSHLRVRGVGGLRVVDASIMPTITSGNTNEPDADDRREGGALDHRLREPRLTFRLNPFDTLRGRTSMHMGIHRRRAPLAWPACAWFARHGSRPTRGMPAGSRSSTARI